MNNFSKLAIHAAIIIGTTALTACEKAAEGVGAAAKAEKAAKAGKAAKGERATRDWIDRGEDARELLELYAEERKRKEQESGGSSQQR
jgi:hypothetical protein